MPFKLKHIGMKISRKFQLCTDLKITKMFHENLGPIIVSIHYPILVYERPITVNNRPVHNRRECQCLYSKSTLDCNKHYVSKNIPLSIHYFLRSAMCLMTPRFLMPFKDLIKKYRLNYKNFKNVESNLLQFEFVCIL